MHGCLHAYISRLHQILPINFECNFLEKNLHVRTYVYSFVVFVCAAATAAAGDAAAAAAASGRAAGILMRAYIPIK